jgi:hypothetical protein
MTRKCLMTVAAAIFAFPFQRASAEALNIQCGREDILIVDWTGPLTVSYPGGPSGELVVKSDHVTLSLPATLSERTGVVDGKEVTARGISGSVETDSLMPDAQALLDCAAKSLQPEFKDDADMQALALMGCVPKTAPSAAPVKIHADVTVGFIPQGDGNLESVIVEIKRRYLDIVGPSGGALIIETFPKDCKLTGP